ncbi:E3 ubiquitin-protein ligase AIRP2 [Senna tora]|uniref:E3 ubiquitin-protein ligase AIRP2 n=1 Tax=Senna tora TaxID=362788 RepID=A0A834WQW5_9FABA|nr:E3 ubiquitin-protein ligase AIRP2 [Senna tora]
MDLSFRPVVKALITSLLSERLGMNRVKRSSFKNKSTSPLPDIPTQQTNEGLNPIIKGRTRPQNIVAPQICSLDLPTIKPPRDRAVKPNQANPITKEDEMHNSFSKTCDEEHDMESTQGWKTNTLKDPLQGIGGPMTRARTKAMKEALNCFIRDLKELEPNYIKESTINMSSKSPRKVVTMLKAQQDDVQGLCGRPRYFPGLSAFWMPKQAARSSLSSGGVLGEKKQQDFSRFAICPEARQYLSNILFILLQFSNEACKKKRESMTIAKGFGESSSTWSSTKYFIGLDGSLDFALNFLTFLTSEHLAPASGLETDSTEGPQDTLRLVAEQEPIEPVAPGLEPLPLGGPGY